MNYENVNCDGCGQPLLEGEDIVVCPDCGTPQHRACYELNNKCVNEHLHESGFIWENPNPPAVVQPVQEEKKEPMFSVSEAPDSEGLPVGLPTAALDVNPVFYERIGISPDAEFDEVKVHDAVSYTQVSAKQYLRKFMRTDGKKHFISWNWGAFFFAPAWFFYRKLYKIGFIFLGLLVAIDLFLAPQYEKVYDAEESMQTTLAEYNEAFKNYSADATAENETVLKAKEAEMRKVFDKIKPAATVSVLFSFVIPNVIAALIADGFYKRKMLADIKIARKAVSDPKILKYTLLRRGGVAIFPAMLAIIVQTYMPSMITQIVNYFILR